MNPTISDKHCRKRLQAKTHSIKEKQSEERVRNPPKAEMSGISRLFIEAAGQGEIDPDGCAAAGGAFYLDAAAMGLHNTSAEAESQAKTAGPA